MTPEPRRRSRPFDDVAAQGVLVADHDLGVVHYRLANANSEVGDTLVFHLKVIHPTE